MGGYGSGASRNRYARRCERMYRIELTYLRKHGLLRAGRSGKLSWTMNGQPSGNIDYEMHRDHMTLNFRTRRGEVDNWRAVRQRINFDWTDTRFGGKQLWFLCPACDRRCSILYGGAEYACRLCHRLVYGSQYEDAMQRAVTRALDLKARLGDRSGIDDPFPRKPKGMHWRTYRGLQAQYEHAQDLFGVVAMQMMVKLAQRL